MERKLEEAWMVEMEKRIIILNISANGTGWEQIYANALARAKKEGWDTMQKALEGGIGFCKDNWLENYQNTLYQNRFDIDSTNGTSLYTHQYMQNLMGAYSEAKTLQSMYKNTGKLDSEFTFIIPVYEEMDKTITPLPSTSSETYPINVATTGTNVLLRSGPSTSSNIIKTITDKGTVFLSIRKRYKFRLAESSYTRWNYRIYVWKIFKANR